MLSRGQALGFTTTLPCLARTDDTPIEPAALKPMPEPEPNVQPTHLLQDYRATALNIAGTALENGAEIVEVSGNWQLKGDGVRINGNTAAEGAVLAAGDVLTTPSGTEYRLIEVSAS